MASLNVRTGPLGKRLAAHLLKRISYSPKRYKVDLAANLNASVAVNYLTNPAPLTLPEPIDPLINYPWINSGVEPLSGTSTLRKYVNAWWMHEALNDISIGHKMEFFLHTTFTISLADVISEPFFDYLALLRYHAVGNIKELAKRMIVDNAMLRYLDNEDNTDDNPNENFAREFLELFTIGKGPQVGPGNYTTFTEQDVVAAARVLTGFRVGNRTQHIDPVTGIPRGYSQISRHDTGQKTFSAAFQNKTINGASNSEEMWNEIAEFVEMVFNQIATAKNICRKLYRFFVSRKITEEIENDIISPLANQLMSNNYQLKPVLRTLFKSRHFFDSDDSNNSDEIIGGFVKSPMDLVLGTLAHFKVDIPDPVSDSLNHYENFYARGVQDIMFTTAGFNLFEPDSVAGYPAYYQEPDYHRGWFDANTIITRYKFPEMLLSGRRILLSGELGGVKLDLVAFVSNPANISNPGDSTVLVTELLQYAFCEYPSPDRINYFMNDILLAGLGPEEWGYEWTGYEITGNDSVVKPLLNDLFIAILYSQEYQLF